VIDLHNGIANVPTLPLPAQDRKSVELIDNAREVIFQGPGERPADTFIYGVHHAEKRLVGRVIPVCHGINDTVGLPFRSVQNELPPGEAALYFGVTTKRSLEGFDGMEDFRCNCLVFALKKEA
jgi:hypothetical protein